MTKRLLRVVSFMLLVMLVACAASEDGESSGPTGSQGASSAEADTSQEALEKDEPDEEAITGITLRDLPIEFSEGTNNTDMFGGSCLVPNLLERYPEAKVDRDVFEASSDIEGRFIGQVIIRHRDAEHMMEKIVELVDGCMNSVGTQYELTDGPDFGSETAWLAGRTYDEMLDREFLLVHALVREGDTLLYLFESGDTDIDGRIGSLSELLGTAIQ